MTHYTAVLLALLGLLAVASAAAPLRPCAPTQNSTGQSYCLATETCCVEQYFGAPGCNVAQPGGGTTCCAPGPALAISTSLPNCLVIGDSVSDQYTPSVAALLKDKCLVQHAPWVGGGSANNAANGLRNLLECRWLRTAVRPDLPVEWDLIAFTFALHDLQMVYDNNLSIYSETLANITDILLASGAKKLLYILSTPYEADALPSCGPYCNAPTPAELMATTAAAATAPWPQPTNGGNGRCGPPACTAGALGCGTPNATAKANSPDPDAPGCGPPSFAVTQLNGAAEVVMAARRVPTLNLSAVVHAHCGDAYSECALCDNETQYMGIECGYHYSELGVGILADAVAAALTGLLGSA